MRKFPKHWSSNIAKGYNGNVYRATKIATGFNFETTRISSSYISAGFPKIFVTVIIL